MASSTSGSKQHFSSSFWYKNSIFCHSISHPCSSVSGFSVISVTEKRTEQRRAETETKKNQELKHLGFVRIAAIRVLVCASNLYDYGKRNSGPLESTVSTAEATLTAVVIPVYEKFKTVPDHLLVFLDHKADEAAHKFDEHAPPVAKHVVTHAQDLIQKASEKAQELVNHVKAGGPRAAVHYAATEYKHFVVNQSVKVWSKLEQYSTVHSVAKVAVPAAASCSEKYNHFVTDMTRNGYTVFTCVPLVPIDEIAKAFKQGEAKAGLIEWFEGRKMQLWF